MKETLKRLLPRNKFARAVSVLAGGTAAGQIIVVAASPLLTRLYSPEDFGLLAVYAGLLGILGVIASLRYQLAIPLPESDEEAASITVLSLLVVLGMTLSCAIVVGIWAQDISVLLNTPDLARYLWLVPIGVLLVGAYQVLTYWAIRVRSFTAIARTKLAQALATVGVQLGAYGIGPLALLLGQAFGHGAGIGSLTALAVRERWSPFRAVRVTDVRIAAVRFRRFPIYSSWGGLLNATGTQLPPILFASLFSPAAAGVYLLANRVLNAPMQLVGKAVANVFFSEAAEARRTGNLSALVASVHQKLAFIAMPPALILLLSGPDLFAFLFGADWKVAGAFAQALSPMVYAIFVTSPISTLTSVLEMQVHAVAFQATLVLARVSGLVLGAWQDQVHLAVLYFSLGSVIAYLGFLIWAFRVVALPVGRAFKDTIAALIPAALIVLPLILGKLGIPGFGSVLLLSFFSVFLTLAFYALLSRHFRRAYV